jgi:hypothetical protein
MARGRLQSSIVYSPTTETARWIGPHTCRRLKPCRIVQYYRLKSQSQGSGTLTAAWIRKWDLLTPSKNINRILANMEYIRRFAMDTAYIARQGQTESRTVYKRHIYSTTCSLHSERTEPSGMCITRLWPNTDWARVWWNQLEASVSEATKAT